MSQSKIDVLGGSIAGGKADMLIEHEGLINEVGLQVQPTVVIASEALDAIKRIDGDIESLPLPNDHNDYLCDANSLEPGNPVLAVRSSAEGDAQGNGVYESVFTPNTPDFAWQGLLRIIRSFHTQDAQEFRRLARLGKNFAVMFQPLVGQVIEGGIQGMLYAPSLSGYGYSQTMSEPYGVINVVAGLGGGVDRTGGEQIDYGSLSRAEELGQTYLPVSPHKNINFFDYIGVLREGQRSLEIPAVYNNDFREQEFLEREDPLKSVAGMALELEGGRPIYVPELVMLPIGDNGFDLEDIVWRRSNFWSDEPDNVIVAAMRPFQPRKLLDALQSMEEKAGYPLYIEWALDSEGQPVVLQIAPFETTDRARLEAEVSADTLLVGKNVVGHGIRQATKIVYCANPRDVAVLQAFNKDPSNEGYILVYRAQLATSLRREGYLITFADMSNASAIVELSSSIHGNAPAADHIAGLYNATHKIFAELDYDVTEFAEFYQKLVSGRIITAPELDPGGQLKVLEGNFKVVADESQKRLFISAEKS